MSDIRPALDAIEAITDLNARCDELRARLVLAERERDDYRSRYETVVAQTRRYNAGLLKELEECRRQRAALEAQLTVAVRRAAGVEVEG